MRKLALSDEVLLSVTQPARYIGGEINMVVKDPSKVDVRFAMCFPDVYDIGMSHLGIQILYDMFNRREDTYCERVYSPWTDLDKIMREEKIPLFALESQDPVKDFDFLGITLQYEMCYTNILQILDLSQIPLHAKERTWEHPIVIGGGPCSYNPEPIAEFFDMFYIGEGEVVYAKLIETYKESRKRGDSREQFLKLAAQIPGIYVPALYDVEYNEDGTLKSFKPNCPEAPEKVEKVLVMDFTDEVYPEKPLVPFIKVTQDRVVLEIMRGCTRGWRFCQAGMLYRPVRERSLEHLVELAESLEKSTGYDEISLSSLSTSDHSQLETVLDDLLEWTPQQHVSLSLPSLRMDNFSKSMVEKINHVRKSGLTFAPEAGTQRLRDVINKNLTEDEILTTCANAFAGGWNNVKLYFMLGLPTETDEDVLGIADLVYKVIQAWKANASNKKRGLRVHVATAFFVPKPHTPFQWEQQITPEEYLRRCQLLKSHFYSKSIEYSYHAPDLSRLEAVMARGDRRLAPVIEKAVQLGARLDGWDEFFRYDLWLDAFRACGVDPNFYTVRGYGEEELLPWDHIDVGVTKKFLLRERRQAYDGKITPDCREGCAGCGANCLLQEVKCDA